MRKNVEGERKQKKTNKEKRKGAIKKKREKNINKRTEFNQPQKKENAICSTDVRAPPGDTQREQRNESGKNIADSLKKNIFEHGGSIGNRRKGTKNPKDM